MGYFTPIYKPWWTSEGTHLAWQKILRMLFPWDDFITRRGVVLLPHHFSRIHSNKNDHRSAVVFLPQKLSSCNKKSIRFNLCKKRKKNNNSAWDAQTFPWALVFVRDLGPLLWCTSWFWGQAQSSCWELTTNLNKTNWFLAPKNKQETIKSGAGPNFTPRSLFYCTFPLHFFPQNRTTPKKEANLSSWRFQSHPSISGGWLLL